MSSAFVLLHQDDNVVICRRNVSAGENLSLPDGAMVSAKADMEIGHKMASAAVARGMPVVKYGMAIGTATQDIEPGDWVHLHNLKSDYIFTHTRQQSSSP